MKSFILDFLSWRRLFSFKALAFQPLGRLACEDLWFTVHFGGLFHFLLSRQAFSLGWLLFLLSSGLSLGLIDLNWFCSLSFHICTSDSLCMLVLAVGIHLVLGGVPHVELWYGAQIFHDNAESLIYSAHLHFCQTNLLFNWVIL